MVWQTEVKKIYESKTFKGTWKDAINIYKENKPKKLYCGFDPIPDGYYRDKTECVKAKKYNYYGLEKVDKKLAEKYKIEKKQKQKQNNDKILLKYVGLKGRLTRYKREYEQMIYDLPLGRSSENEIKNYEKLIKKTSNELEEIKKQINK